MEKLKRGESGLSNTQDRIVYYLTNNYFFHRKGANIGEWRTYPKGQESFIELEKPHSEKTLAMVCIRLYQYDERYGLNFKVEMQLNSYLEWESFFEGWVSTLPHFMMVLQHLGIPDKSFVKEDTDPTLEK